MKKNEISSKIKQKIASKIVDKLIMLSAIILLRAIGILNSYFKVPTISRIPKKELYSVKTPKSSGAYILVIIGENRIPKT